MHKLLCDAEYESMELDAYWQDFERNFWRTRGPGFWKLERGQYFQEPGNDSWEAYARGEWQESLDLIEAGLPGMRDYYARVARNGFSTRRVRIVEEPVTDYLQWELHVLRARHENGGPVRVLGPDAISRWESDDPLPEIYTLGLDVMYEAVYDDRGRLDSARKYTDRDVVHNGQELIAELYSIGEPLSTYFDRRIAQLTVPPGERLE